MRALAILLCLLATPCAAQGFSSTEWTIAGRTVQLRVTLPTQAVRPLVGNTLPVASNAALATYVLAHLDVHAAGTACPAIDQGQGVGRIDTLAPLPDEYRYEIVFQCTQDGPLRLDDHMLFERTPDHLDFARLLDAGQPPVLQVFDATHQNITLPADNALRNASVLTYLALGLRHVFAGLAQLACVFAIAIALVPRRRAEWIACATALAAGAALGLALDLTGSLALQPEPAEATIGLLAVILALRRDRHRTVAAAVTSLLLVVLAAGQAWTGHGTPLLLFGAALLAPGLLLGNQTWLQLIPPALFGLLDGAAFRTAIHTLSLPRWSSLVPLAGYAAGGLAAAALIAAATLPIRRAPPILTNLAGAAVACCGMVWFVSHL